MVAASLLFASLALADNEFNYCDNRKCDPYCQKACECSTYTNSFSDITSGLTVAGDIQQFIDAIIGIVSATGEMRKKLLTSNSALGPVWACLDGIPGGINSVTTLLSSVENGTVDLGEVSSTSATLFCSVVGCFAVVGKKLPGLAAISAACSVGDLGARAIKCSAFRNSCLEAFSNDCWGPARVRTICEKTKLRGGDPGALLGVCAEPYCKASSPDYTNCIKQLAVQICVKVNWERCGFPRAVPDISSYPDANKSASDSSRVSPTTPTGGSSSYSAPGYLVNPQN